MNKTQRKEALRELIDAQDYEAPFSQQDVEQMNSLTGWEFPMYKRTHNPQWPNDTRCVAHTTDGQEWVVWSWNKAVEGRDPKKNLLEALRAGAAAHMREFALTAPDECAVCGTNKLLSIDHKTVPFKHIAQEFIQTLESIDDVEAFIVNTGNGSGWKLCDEAMQMSWHAFHGNRADYQVLCRSCNSRKGSKHALRKQS